MSPSPILPLNLRRQRARALAAHIFNTLQDHIPRIGWNTAKYELENLLYLKDVEILTRDDRIAAGLPERDETGLTPEQHRLWDAFMFKRMTEPPALMVMTENGPRKL